MEHGMNCPHHADKDEACTCALTERTMHAAWRKRAEEAETRIASLEAQVKALTEERDAQAEAVRVLGAWLRLWRLFKGRPRSEVDAPGTPYRVFRDAQREVWNNPIARAAVEHKETQ